MLEALYDYAVNNSLVFRPGFQRKNVRYYISFSLDGNFLSIDQVEKDTEHPMCPDIGGNNQIPTVSNFIAERAEIIFNYPEQQKDGTLIYKRKEKQKFYMDALKKASEHDPLFKSAVIGFTKDMDKIQKAFADISKAKYSDILSIKVDGKALESSAGYLDWWDDYRNSLNVKKKSSDEVRCFITGKLTKPENTVPSFQGLNLVGVDNNVKLICFDKDAYKSYEFDQAANAAVSAEAITAVNTALTELLKQSPPSLAETRNIHWFSEQTDNDVTELMDVGFGIPDKKAGLSERSEQIEEDESRVQKMFTALMNRSLPEMPHNRYYMMSISGLKTRAMIRGFDEGTYDELCGNLRKWFENIAIYVPKHGYKYPNLTDIYSRLKKLKKNVESDSKKSKDENDDKEISGLSTNIIYSAMHNTPLPDTVAARVLAYIRSDLLSSQEDDENKAKKPKKSKKPAVPKEPKKANEQRSPDRIACQILKAWLNRKYRKQNKEEFLIMDKLNSQSPSAAYQAGRLMAEYAAIQTDALGDVNAGVVERYYTAACASPALVMGKLSTMSQYHLSKLKGEQRGLYEIHSKALEEISCMIGSGFPNRFTLEQQSEFALGYYFQCAEIRARKTKKTEE